MAETSTDRLRRLLTLVPWLAAHSGISKADAAAHFGLTVRQLEADLSLITVTGPGMYGGELVDIYFDDETVTVADAQGLLQPLQLTGDESASLLLGLRALQQLPDVDAGVVAGLVDKLGAADDSIVVRVDPSPFAAVVAAAIRDEQDVRFEYVHPVRDEVGERIVTPAEIVSRDGVDYLTGLCHTAGATRTFRLDRMRRCTALPREGAPAVISADSRDVHVATLLFEPASQYLAEGLRANVIGHRDAALEVQVEYADEGWLVWWLMSAGAGVRCVDPAAVQDRVRSAAATALQAYRESL